MTEDITSEVEIFATLLENAGLKQKSPGDKSAIAIVHDELLPKAQEEHLSLLQAARACADPAEEQCTLAYQLFHALQQIRPTDLKRSGLNKPL